MELLIRFSSLALLLLLLQSLLAVWVSPGAATSGCLLLLCLLPLGFYVNPVIDSYPAMCTLVAGLHLIVQRRWWSLPALIFVGTFVRETPVLLVPISGLALWREMGFWRLGTLLLLETGAWGAVRLGLWVIVPGQTFMPMATFNVGYFFRAGIFAAALRLATMFGPLVFAALALRRLRGLPRAMGITGLAYAASLLVVARMNEPRVFYEAYVLVLPALLASVGLWDPRGSMATEAR